LCSNKRYVLLGVARSFGGTQKITGIHRQEGINNWKTRRGDAKRVVSSLEQRISCAFFVPIIVSLDEETVLVSPVVGWSPPVSVGWTVNAIVVVAVVAVNVVAIIAVG